MVEPQIVDLAVAGSNPVSHPRLSKRNASGGGGWGGVGESWNWRKSMYFVAGADCEPGVGVAFMSVAEVQGRRPVLLEPGLKRASRAEA